MNNENEQQIEIEIFKSNEIKSIFWTINFINFNHESFLFRKILLIMFKWKRWISPVHCIQFSLLRNGWISFLFEKHRRAWTKIISEWEKRLQKQQRNQRYSIFILISFVYRYIFLLFCCCCPQTFLLLALFILLIHSKWIPANNIFRMKRINTVTIGWNPSQLLPAFTWRKHQSLQYRINC